MRLPRGRLVAASTAGAVCLLVGLAGCGGGHPTAARDTSPSVTVTSSDPVSTPGPLLSSTSTSPQPTVAALKTVVTPDVLVVAKAPLTGAQLATLKAKTKATSALLVDAGTVHLAAGTTTALAVNPSTFRGYTPTVVASSTPLWQSVARGEAAVAYAVAQALTLPLGGMTTVGAAAPAPVRVGAYATTGLPGVGVVVDTSAATALDLAPSTGLILTAAGQDPVVTAAIAQSVLGTAGTATAARVPTAGGKLQWVAPAAGPITSPFGPRSNPNRPGQIEIHEGVDIGAPLGSPIYAAAAGVVQYAGPASGFGQEVVLQHAGDVTTVYGHMEAILVRSGPVRAGQPIALVGAEGDATGPHLHFEVHVDDKPINPIPWLLAHGVVVKP